MRQLHRQAHPLLLLLLLLLLLQAQAMLQQVRQS
jgi:hypothetical protein